MTHCRTEFDEKIYPCRGDATLNLFRLKFEPRNIILKLS